MVASEVNAFKLNIGKAYLKLPNIMMQFIQLFHNEVKTKVELLILKSKG